MYIYFYMDIHHSFYYFTYKTYNMDTPWQWLISFGILLYTICLISMVICYVRRKAFKEGFLEYIFDSIDSDTDSIARSFSRIGIVITAIAIGIGLLFFIHHSIFK